MFKYIRPHAGLAFNIMPNCMDDEEIMIDDGLVEDDSKEEDEEDGY